MSAENRQQVIWPQLATREELGVGALNGSFSRNVRIGENGFGMRWNNPGDAFALEAVYRGSVGSGTEIAPGTFEAIYINYSDRILKVDSLGNCVEVYREQGKDEISYNIENLFEGNYGNTMVMIDGENVKEVILKKWGVVHHSSKPMEIHPKARPNPHKLEEVPLSKIELEFRALQNRNSK